MSSYALFTADLSPQDGPAVRWLQQTLQEAVQWEASDIHIEPHETGARIRMRIDGVLQETASIECDLREIGRAHV